MSAKRPRELRSDSARKRSNRVCIVVHWHIIASFLPACGPDGAWRLTQLRRGVFSSAALLAHPRTFVGELAVREHILNESLLTYSSAAFLSHVVGLYLAVLRPYFRGEPPVDSECTYCLVDTVTQMAYRVRHLAFIVSLLVRFGRAGIRVRVLCESQWRGEMATACAQLVGWSHVTTTGVDKRCMVFVTSSCAARRSHIDLMLGNPALPKLRAATAFHWSERETTTDVVAHVDYYRYPPNIGCAAQA